MVAPHHLDIVPLPPAPPQRGRRQLHTTLPHLHMLVGLVVRILASAVRRGVRMVRQTSQ